MLNTLNSKHWRC